MGEGATHAEFEQNATKSRALLFPLRLRLPIPDSAHPYHSCHPYNPYHPHHTYTVAHPYSPSFIRIAYLEEYMELKMAGLSSLAAPLVSPTGAGAGAGAGAGDRRDRSESLTNQHGSFAFEDYDDRGKVGGDIY